jgi:hypothetical protein
MVERERERGGEGRRRAADGSWHPTEGEADAGKKKHGLLVGRFSVSLMMKICVLFLFLFFSSLWALRARLPVVACSARGTSGGEARGRAALPAGSFGSGHRGGQLGPWPARGWQWRGPARRGARRAGSPPVATAHGGQRGLLAVRRVATRLGLLAGAAAASVVAWWVCWIHTSSGQRDSVCSSSGWRRFVFVFVYVLVHE